jgi:ribosomally synthesized peptide (two-chain TOMM family)
MAGPFYPDIESEKRQMGDEPLLTAWEISASWRSIWLKAIARSWRDPAFRSRLLNPTMTVATLKEVGFDVPTFFGKLLEIEVTEPPQSSTITYVSTAVVKNRFKNGWVDPTDALRAKLTLVLPPAPQSPDDFGIAIADYDSGGRVYPFTMC